MDLDRFFWWFWDLWWWFWYWSWFGPEVLALVYAIAICCLTDRNCASKRSCKAWMNVPHLSGHGDLYGFIIPWNVEHELLDYNEMGCPIVSCQTHVDSKNLFKWKYSLRPIHSQRANRITQVRRLTNNQDYRFRSGSTNHLFTSSPDRIRLAVAVNKVGPMWCSSLVVKHIVSWVGATGAMFTPSDSKEKCGNILREQRVTSCVLCTTRVTKNFWFASPIYRYIISLPLKLQSRDVQRSDIFPHLSTSSPHTLVPRRWPQSSLWTRRAFWPCRLSRLAFWTCHAVPRMACHPSWWYLRWDFETFLRWRIRSRLKKNDASVCDSGSTWPHSTKFNRVLSKRTSRSILIHQGCTPFHHSLGIILLVVVVVVSPGEVQGWG